LRAYNAAKCDCGAPPDPIAGFKGPLRGGEGDGEGMGRGRDGKGKGREG